MNRRELLLGTAAFVGAASLPEVSTPQMRHTTRKIIMGSWDVVLPPPPHFLGLIETAEEVKHYFGPSSEETKQAYEFFGVSNEIA